MMQCLLRFCSITWLLNTDIKFDHFFQQLFQSHFILESYNCFIDILSFEKTVLESKVTIKPSIIIP